MNRIQENSSLKPYNTFGIEVKARYFTEVTSLQELNHVLSYPLFRSLPRLILGGGSNVLFTGDFPGVVIKNSIKGIEVTAQDDDFVFVKSGAGVVWHDLVLYCIDKNYAGVENLSLIPGSVGAGPMQNIGAYGVELKEVFHELEAISLEDGVLKIFSKEECRFGYRESVFKKELKGKFVIVSVTLKLRKHPVFNTSYGAVENELKAMGVETLSIRAVSEAVCRIRRSKLPDPTVTGNAGSFFKNPEVLQEQFSSLKKQYSELIAYPASPGKMKLAAGWLIEQCGWKGKREGDAGVHKNQALVIVNYGHATGKKIYDLAVRIKNSVKEKFGVDLDMEVNII